MVGRFPQQNGLRGAPLKQQANFSWMTCGGLNAIGIATELGDTSLLITENAKYVLSDSIEALRMVQEEGVEKLGFTPTMSIEAAGVRFTWPATLAKG